MKKFLKLLIVFMISLALLPMKVMAVSTDFELTVTAISNPTTVVQDKIGYGVTLNFDLKKKDGASAEAMLSTGDTFELSTNLGELFEITDSSAYTDVSVTDGDNTVLATVTLTENTLTLKIAEGASGSTEISNGQVVFQDKLKAKNVGADAENKNETKTLTIGTARKDVTFQYIVPGSVTSSFNPVDIDTFWENAGNISIKGGTDNTGATYYMEVNPIGSMDLYGSTTYPNRKPTAYDQLYVENTIPEHGFIDETTIQIYAAIPEIGYPSEDSTRNGYSVPSTTLYAVRTGTYRAQLNTGDAPRITRIYQNDNETLDAFRTRIRSSQLQWGIYEAKDGTQTFLCNFGAVGTETNNNGIMYSDFCNKNSKQMTTYADIFGTSGASHGNIVSYYIEFNTYYPQIVGAQQLTNNSYMAFSANTVNLQKRNDATYKINNGGGTGVAKKRNVIVKVVEEGTNTAIANAQVKLQKKDTNGNYVDCIAAKTTDENGLLSFGPLGDGDYKLVQTAAPSKYEFDNKTYGASGSNKANEVTSTGEFTISSTDTFGFGTVVTNKVRSLFKVSYEFQSSTADKELPTDVTSLLPTDDNSYYNGDKVTATNPKFQKVAVQGGYWTFDGYKPNDITIADADVKFIGKWSFTAEYTVTYEFVSATDGKELPQSVKDLLPKDANVYTNNKTVKAITPSDTKVDVEDGYWSFQGYDADTITVNNANVVFTGKWIFTGKHYVTYEFQSSTAGKELPDSVKVLLPTDTDSYYEGTKVTPKNPISIKVGVQDGYWTFDGYSEKEITIADEDAKFIGTWSFTAQYTVTYEFVSDTDDKDLPQSVMNLLPTDSKKYEKGDIVEVREPSKTKVTDGKGYWSFEGYILPEMTLSLASADEIEPVEADDHSNDSLKEITVAEDNIVLYGLWSYTPEYTVSYEFQSNTAGKELPESITALLPTDDNSYIKDMNVKAAAPEKTKVTDGKGYWTFDGYTADEVTVNDTDIVFTGLWSYTPEYTVSYKFQSSTAGKELPESITALLPTDDNSYIKDTNVKAVEPEQTKVTDGKGYWTFDGYTADEITVNDTDIVFTGLWSYTENNTNSSDDKKSDVTPTPTPSSSPTISPTSSPATPTPSASAAPKSTASSTADSKDTRIVDTGDTNDLMLFTGILFVSLTGICFILAYRKKYSK